MNLLNVLLLLSIAIPYPGLTPGAVRTTDLKEICAPGYDKAHRTWHKERQTAQKYGVPWAQHHLFQDDDWYPVGLGGDNANPLNHWMQPLPQARKKDRLEDYEIRLACAHYKATGDRDATPYQKVFPHWDDEYKRVFGEDP